MLEDLIAAARPDIAPARRSHYIETLILTYPEAAVAVNAKNLTLIRELSHRFDKRPTTSTRRFVAEMGIRMGDAFRAGDGGNATLLLAWTYDGRPLLMKRLDEVEVPAYRRAEERLVGNVRERMLEGTTNPDNLVDFYFVEVESPPSSQQTSPAAPGAGADTRAQPGLTAGSLIPLGQHELARTPQKTLSKEGKVETRAVSRAWRRSQWAVMLHFTRTMCGFPTSLNALGACRLVFQISRALQCLHEGRLVHMDVKPDNILVSAAGDFALGDFGSVRASGEFVKSSTPAFMPQELRPQRESNIRADPSLDWWMFGVTVIDLRTAAEERVGHGSRPGLTMDDVILGLKSLLTEASAMVPAVLPEHLVAVDTLIELLTANHSFRYSEARD